ncbi:MAG: TRAP transporter substrate-binding protein [Acidiferrobacterales bacterium]|nr:TRAP transporter substrate-binding protein [Acidiferrobacterales bacterium]
MITRRKALTAMAGMGAIGIVGCGENSSRPLYASDHHLSDYPTVKAVEAMSKLLSQKTQGRLSIKVYSGGQLGSERDTLEITVFGGLDFNRVNAAPLNSLAPMTVVPCLPFLFQDENHLHRALDGAPGQTILDSLQDHGLVGLCYYDSGMRSFYNTKKPIRNPDDMAGMKIRVQNSDVYVSMINALGADATPMYLGEVYQSLVQGVIDGAENNWPSYQAGRHYEVAQYYSLTRHVMAPEILVMSKHRWRSLSDADQAAVVESAKESVAIMRQLWTERVKQARQTVIASGVEVNEVDNISEFSELMKPLWQRKSTLSKQKELIEQILDLRRGAL